MSLQETAIGCMACQAMLLEVAATPKPGLVDHLNNGAHQDMDYQTFLASIAALTPHVRCFARLGAASAADSPAELFQKLRRQGVLAEQDMFRATGGINTHKGELFSLGLLCGAAGRASNAGRSPLTPECLCTEVSLMTAGICDREFSGLQKKENLSHGERIYLQYGAKGIRGEVESGFASIRLHAYPVLEHHLLQKSKNLNDILVHVLLHLMACIDDTNILARHDADTAAAVKKQARYILTLGGALTRQGHLAILELDRVFCARRISPGGCADLLAATLFLWMLCHEDQVSELVI